ncbi:MAG: MBOAT family protein [Clostridiales bacterium]|nr:MBOAT family protein [Clostridiales bacterium]
MEFASANFLFIFLPVVYLLYLVLPWKKVRNWLLIAASLVFYAWGELYYVALMVFSATVNFFIALWMKRRGEKNNKALLIAAIVFNIGLLAVFKYAAFAVESVNGVFSVSIPVPKIPSPLGISFFTFQALSYVIDVYRKDIEPTKDYGNFLLYISFFAQLVQGPIIRYSTIAEQLDDRKLTAEGTAEGLRLFIIGLAMKLVIANSLGRVTAYVYGLEASSLNAAYAWAGAVCFMLQIYFDFAGYSQMAIGLGRMFGFTIPQNFNYPYIAYSMTDFWRRWHITLSRWFRDYVYIPLGGNRRSAFRTGLNKIIVFLLTGLWHGANWTFVVWGAYNGAFLLGENYIKKTKFRLPKIVTWLYTIIAVTVGFAIFNSPNMAYAWAMIKNMFAGFPVSADSIAGLSGVFKPTTIAILIAAVIGATPLAKIVCSKLDNKPVLQAVLRYGIAVVLFVLCLFFIASGNFNPSIYTQF